VVILEQQEHLDYRAIVEIQDLQGLVGQLVLLAMLDPRDKKDDRAQLGKLAYKVLKDQGALMVKQDLLVLLAQVAQEDRQVLLEAQVKLGKQVPLDLKEKEEIQVTPDPLDQVDQGDQLEL
jgi:hypothetical protein